MCSTRDTRDIGAPPPPRRADIRRENQTWLTRGARPNGSSRGARSPILVLPRRRGPPAIDLVGVIALWGSAPRRAGLAGRQKALLCAQLVKRHQWYAKPFRRLRACEQCRMGYLGILLIRQPIWPVIVPAL